MLKSLFSAVATFLEEREDRTTLKFLEKRRDMAQKGFALWPAPSGNLIIGLATREDAVHAANDYELCAASLRRKRDARTPGNNLA